MGFSQYVWVFKSVCGAFHALLNEYIPLLYFLINSIVCLYRNTRSFLGIIRIRIHCRPIATIRLITIVIQIDFRPFYIKNMNGFKMTQSMFIVCKIIDQKKKVKKKPKTKQNKTCWRLGTNLKINDDTMKTHTETHTGDSKKNRSFIEQYMKRVKIQKKRNTFHN